MVKVPRSTETGAAPAGQGAVREHIRPYVTEAQRSPRTMQTQSNAATTFTTGC